jgi:hypothetical protein
METHQAGPDCESARTREVPELLIEIESLRSELHRMSAQIERQKTDIASLEKERLRLANRVPLRLAVFAGDVTGIPRTIPQRVKRLAFALARRMLVHPKVRVALRRMRNDISA